MPVRKAKAVWEGGLRQGKGVMELQSQAFQWPYSYPSRFEEGEGTNPEAVSYTHLTLPTILLV